MWHAKASWLVLSLEQKRVHACLNENVYVFVFAYRILQWGTHCRATLESRVDGMHLFEIVLSSFYQGPYQTSSTMHRQILWWTCSVHAEKQHRHLLMPIASSSSILSLPRWHTFIFSLFRWILVDLGGVVFVNIAGGLVACLH